MRVIRAEASAPRTPRLTAREYAVQSAIERQLARYFLLKCGHLTTPDTQLLYANWKPKGRVFYCETCDIWVIQMPKPKTQTDSDTPLF